MEHRKESDVPSHSQEISPPRNGWKLMRPHYWVVGVIVVYQRLISPLLGPRCKYYPSCSSYARQSFVEYGLWSGGVRTAWRLVRCNPFSDGGFDPVKSRPGKTTTANTVS